MKNIYYLSIPIISMFTGYFTNYLAIKLLFHPRKKIDLFLFSIQGVFPKRQDEIALRLGEVIEKELISHHDLRKTLTDSDFTLGLKERMSDTIVELIRKGAGDISPMVAMMLSEEVLFKIREKVEKEMTHILPSILKNVADEMERKISIKHMISEKVKDFSAEKLEDLLLQILKKEFRFIEFSGAFIGLLIGLLNLLIIFLNN